MMSEYDLISMGNNARNMYLHEKSLFKNRLKSYVTEWNKKQKVHILHPIKTGGLSLRKAIGCECSGVDEDHGEIEEGTTNCHKTTSTDKFVCHGHGITCKSIPKNEPYVVIVRDPEERAKSFSKYWRKKITEDILRDRKISLPMSEYIDCPDNPPAMILHTETLDKDYQEFKRKFCLPGECADHIPHYHNSEYDPSDYQVKFGLKESECVRNVWKQDYIFSKDRLNQSPNNHDSLYRSQVGQDKYMNNTYIHNQINGVFVDVGAFDGETGSNSYFFEKALGWTGICIEPQLDQYQKLLSKRDCISINAAAFNKNTNIKFRKTGSSPQLSGIVGCHDIGGFMKNVTQIQIIDIPTVQLKDLFHQYNIQIIDYLSIDTEGSEFEVLKGIDWNFIHINIINLEHGKQEEKLNKITQFLSQKGFIVDKYIKQDVFFKNRDLRWSWSNLY